MIIVHFAFCFRMVYSTRMNIKEFARLAGVSASTVSKIMNGKDAGIRPETREHVLRLAKEYHYKPASYGVNADARTLVLGVVTGSQRRFDMTLAGFVEQASVREYTVLVKDSHGDKEAEKKNILAMLAMNVDGLILDPVASSDLSEILALVEKSNTPYRFLSSEHNLMHALPAIDFDHMGYAAGEALISLGHRDIACLLYEGSRSAGLLRGFKKCLYDHSVILNEDLIFHDEEAMLRKIGAGLFTGIVVSHYSVALRVYHRIRDLHYAVPNDLSIVALNNSLADIPDSQPVISSIRIPFFEYGEYLAEHLIREIEKQPEPPAFSLPTGIDSDTSVGAPFPTSVKRVLSIGSINIDNYLDFSELPRAGTAVASSSLTVFSGGKCINQAIGAALLGHPVSVIGRVGDDTDSDAIFRTIREYAIDHQGLLRTEREKTGQAYIFVGKNGESMISLLPGANRMLLPDDMARNRHLFSQNGFCLLQTEIPMSAVIEAARIAKEQHMTTVLKPSACDSLPDALLCNVDMLIPNLNELHLLSPEGESTEEKADCFLNRGVSTVIVTCGAAGCYVRAKNISVSIPAIDITAVDVTGAGDAFISCLISYMIDGYDTVRAARIATYAAGLSTIRKGTVPALVNRTTLESYIMNKEPDLLQPFTGPAS